MKTCCRPLGLRGGRVARRAVRDALLTLTALLAFGAVAPRASAATAPLRLIRTVPMPGVQGDFDHFIVDLPHNRLFVTTEDHATLEVFDLHTGAHVGSIAGFGSPHSGVFLPARNRLLVTDSDAGAVRVLDATSYKMLKTIPAVPQADAMTYDPAEHLMYVTGGGEDAHLNYSLIGIIDTRRDVKVGEIRIPSTNIESVALTPGGRLLYVNIRDHHAIGVVDRHTLKLMKTWTLQRIRQNTPLILDAHDQRLFVGGRGPGVFAVLDASDGHVMASLPAPEGVDDLSWNPKSGRIYFPCMDGHLAVFRQIDADHYESLGTVPTGYRGKTGVLVPQLDRYFVATVAHGGTPARLFVFQVLPDKGR
ncbi:MAG: YncE family protein [Steroidobacteraceae bacterium]